MIDIKPDYTIRGGKRATLLLELDRLRSQMKRLQLRVDQLHIMLRDEDYDGEDLFQHHDRDDRDGEEERGDGS